MAKGFGRERVKATGPAVPKAAAKIRATPSIPLNTGNMHDRNAAFTGINKVSGGTNPGRGNGPGLPTGVAVARGRQ